MNGYQHLKQLSSLSNGLAILPKLPIPLGSIMLKPKSRPRLCAKSGILKRQLRPSAQTTRIKKPQMLLISLNRKLIIDFVKSSISKNSIVRITGGTDRLGEADYNKKLSVERAKSVRKFLRSIKPDINIVEVQGKGASELKYNNDLPEGRFYCRTVMIEIKTPVK